MAWIRLLPGVASFANDHPSGWVIISFTLMAAGDQFPLSPSLASFTIDHPS
jgi:hypothetical protein